MKSSVVSLMVFASAVALCAQSDPGTRSSLPHLPTAGAPGPVTGPIFCSSHINGWAHAFTLQELNNGAAAGNSPLFYYGNDAPSERGYDRYQIEEHAPIFVSRKQRIASLSLAQLGGIFTGKITRWEQVKGVGGPIQIYFDSDPTVMGKIKALFRASGVPLDEKKITVHTTTIAVPGSPAETDEGAIVFGIKRVSQALTPVPLADEKKSSDNLLRLPMTLYLRSDTPPNEKTVVEKAFETGNKTLNEVLGQKQ